MLSRQAEDGRGELTAHDVGAITHASRTGPDSWEEAFRACGFKVTDQMHINFFCRQRCDGSTCQV